MSKKTLAIAHSRNNTVVLQIKLNQPNLHTEIIDSCKLNTISEELNNFEINRGRQETRNIKLFSFRAKEWPEITLGASLLRNTVRKHGKNIKESRNPNYYLCNKNLSATKLNHTIRQHCTIENTNHGVRDNVMLEDKNRIRTKAENMMIIRSFGYNIVQSNKQNNAFSTQIELNKLDFDTVFQFKGIHSM